MQCVNDKCPSLTTRVNESRPTQAATYRRRQCPVCKTLCVTIEVISPVQSIPELARPRNKEVKP